MFDVFTAQCKDNNDILKQNAPHNHATNEPKLNKSS